MKANRSQAPQRKLLWRRGTPRSPLTRARSAADLEGLEPRPCYAVRGPILSDDLTGWTTNSSVITVSPGSQ